MADIEVFRARNTTGLAINGTRVTNTKPYGLIQTTQLFKCKDEDIIEALSAGVKPVDRWIVVTESPKENGYYLVCDANGRYEVAKYERSEGSGIGCWTTHSIGNIEYWQSLPEPPKDGERNG